MRNNNKPTLTLLTEQYKLSEFSYLLHEDHHGAVDLDGHDGGQKAERDVGEDRDQGEVTDREE